MCRIAAAIEVPPQLDSPEVCAPTTGSNDSGSSLLLPQAHFAFLALNMCLGGGVVPLELIVPEPHLRRAPQHGTIPPLSLSDGCFIAAPRWS